MELTLTQTAYDHDALFHDLFAPHILLRTFNERFATSAGKGLDRINGFTFANRAPRELTTASRKCLAGTYRFTPYLEKLKIKERNKNPRLIGIPTIRDRVILHQLHRYLTHIFPECIQRNVASTYVREISEDISRHNPDTLWICGTDIKTFYDSIRKTRLLAILEKRITCKSAIRLIHHALETPTVPKNCPRKQHNSYKVQHGVPQGLAISNILAAIYMQDVDSAIPQLGVKYYRYVDDVLIYGEKALVEKAFNSLRSRLRNRGLSLHRLGTPKSYMRIVNQGFAYLGYIFKWPKITIRDSTIERFLQSISGKFSDFKHNKQKRLERYSYLDEKRLSEIFLLELNERITGAISEQKRYGWIAYFSEITDLSLLHRLDAIIANLFSRLAEFNHQPPKGLRKLRRAYYEMKYNPEGGYIRNYDRIISSAEKISFLEERGRIGPHEQLTDEQINDRYERYKRRALSEMHADEGVIYQ